VNHTCCSSQKFLASAQAVNTIPPTIPSATTLDEDHTILFSYLLFPVPKRDMSGETSRGPSADIVAGSSPAPESGKLSAKELKEKKKREKAERRQQAKSDAPATPQRPPKPQPPKKEAQGKGKKGAQPTAAHDSGIVKTIYSQQSSKVLAGGKVPEAALGARDKDLPSLMKELEIEQHEKKKKPLFGVGSAHPDVHPAILTLGVQMNQFILVGSSARCLGFMLAMKRVGLLLISLIIIYHSSTHSQKLRRGSHLTTLS